MWWYIVTWSFSVLLLGAAILANLGDGPLREHRGSWVTHVSR